MPFFDIRVVEARGVPAVGVFRAKPTPYVIIKCAGNQFKTSTVVLGTHVPQWEEASRFYCQNPSTDRVEVSIYDKKGILDKIDSCLGTLYINLDSPNLEQGVVKDRWYSFPNSSCHEIRLRIMCHDFGFQQQSVNAQQQYQQQLPAEVPVQYQSQYISPPRPPQQQYQQQQQQQQQNSYNQYPVAQISNNQNHNPATTPETSYYNNHVNNNNQRSVFSNFFGGGGGTAGRNTQGGYQSLPSNEDPVQIAETLQSAPLEYGQIDTRNGPPAGYTGY